MSYTKNTGTQSPQGSQDPIVRHLAAQKFKLLRALVTQRRIRREMDEIMSLLPEA